MTEQSLKQKTARGLFWGGFSNGVQQLLNLLFGIVLARLLDDTDYGMIGVLAIFMAVANTLQESGFTAALANKRNITHEDYNAVFWFSLLMGTGMYIVLFFSAPLIARFFKAPELVPLSRYLFLGFVFSSSATAHSAYLFRNLMVKQKAISQIPSLILSGTVGILMAYHGMSYWGIATQSLVYIGTINLCFWYFSPWRPTFKINFRPIKEMFGFSSKLLVTNIFLQINNNLLSTILGRFYSKAEVGTYTQSNKWTAMGFSLIGGMVNSVAQPVLAEVSNDNERQQNVLRKMLRFTAFLSFPAMFGLALISEEFIIITITEKWAACIPVLQALCLWGAFVPVTNLYSNLILSKGKSDIYMWNTIALSLLQLGVMLAAHPYGLQTMILLFVLINVVWLGVWQYFVWKLTGLSVWKAMKDILPFALIAAATMIATYYITMSIGNRYLMLGAKILTAAAIYTFAMWISHAAIFREVIAYIRRKSPV